MRIAVTGTRGIPDIQGGVETHCEFLFPLIAEEGHEVILMRRDCYVPAGDSRKEYKGVRLMDVHAPRRKSLEAIVHTFRSVLRAKRMRADIVHIHAVGPALLTPLARLLGMKAVVTHHGNDYERAKWGKLAKSVIRLGERMGAKYANRVIVISHTIENQLQQKYPGVKTRLIFNGVPAARLSDSTDYIESLGLEPGKYIVAIGRFVPEKNFHQLIEAFSRGVPGDVKLAIAGDADHPDAYSENLKKQAKEHGVVLTGFIKGDRMRELMSHAALFVLPSAHEGLPISLLEAMSYSRDVLVSDIAANRLPELSEDDFFPTGDVGSLHAGINAKLKKGSSPRVYDLSEYDWQNIARKTLKVYEELVDPE